MRYILFALTAVALVACSKNGGPEDTGLCTPNGLFADNDGDGFGNPEAPLCGDSEGASNNLDCDDAQTAVNPDAEENCATAADDNCDGSSNDIDAVGCSVFYGDGDNDGFPGEDLSACICEPDTTYAYTSADTRDCDDTLASVNPDALEDCATPWDDNCDEDVNSRNADNCILFYEDVDADGFGGTESGCYCTPTSIYTTPDGGDCDDSNAETYPGAPELCNGSQEDCLLSPWTLESEHAQVSFEDVDGTWTDVTPQFQVQYAVTENGTLHVCPGDYELGIQVDGLDEVYITGRGDTEDITVTSSTSPALEIKDSQVVASNVSLQGRQASSSSSGGAVRVDGTNLTLAETEYHLRLRDAVLSDSRAGLGGGLYASNARIFLGDTRVEDNAAGSGGGVYLDASEFLADNVVLISNEATQGQGGAVYATNGSELLFEESTIEKNIAHQEGGGLYLDSSPLGLRDTIVQGNESGSVGAGVYTYRGDVSCTASLTSLEAGIYNNREVPQSQVATGIGLYAEAANSSIPTLTIYASNCDLGSNSSTKQPDNSPDDLVFETTFGKFFQRNYDNDASFTCTMQGDIVKCR